MRGPLTLRGWFDSVPAYRLATVRTLLALVTIGWYLPTIDTFLWRYGDSSFHQSMIPGLPDVGGHAVILGLIIVQHVAAWCLLMGLESRLAAAVLFVIGGYAFVLDDRHFSNNLWFHLNLLLLLACSNERVSLGGLLSGRDGDRCAVWPERLMCLFAAIVFLYATADKIVSPFWGTGGEVILERQFSEHAPPLNWLQDVNRRARDAGPGALSVFTIACEAAIGVLFALGTAGYRFTPLILVFAWSIQFFVAPGVFAWDVLSLSVLLAPVGDRAYGVVVDETNARGRSVKRAVVLLDWLRRVRWGNSPASELEVLTPKHRQLHGFVAYRQLLALMPWALYVALVWIALEGFGERYLYLWPANDVALLVSLGTGLLWTPGLARAIESLAGRLGKRAANGHSIAAARGPDTLELTAKNDSSRRP